MKGDGKYCCGGGGEYDSALAFAQHRKRRFGNGNMRKEIQLKLAADFAHFHKFRAARNAEAGIVNKQINTFYLRKSGVNILLLCDIAAKAFNALDVARSARKADDLPAFCGKSLAVSFPIPLEAPVITATIMIFNPFVL